MDLKDFTKMDIDGVFDALRWSVIFEGDNSVYVAKTVEKYKLFKLQGLFRVVWFLAFLPFQIHPRKICFWYKIYSSDFSFFNKKIWLVYKLTS